FFCPIFIPCYCFATSTIAHLPNSNFMRKSLQKTARKRLLNLLPVMLTCLLALPLLQVSATGIHDPITANIAPPVTGKVLSSTGDPLQGVSIEVKGTNTGTTSAADGSYSISVPEGKNILIFTLVGYLAQEVNIAGRSRVHITL